MNRRLFAPLLTLVLAALVVPRHATASVDTAWVRLYDGPGRSGDAATLVAVDSAGNVYVAGSSTGVGTGLDFVVIKYYPNGDTAWVRRRDFGGDDTPSGAEVDAQGNVFVSGTTGNGRIATVKYSSTGQLVWTRLFGTRARGKGLGLDVEGNAVLCGETLGTTADVAVVKYLPSGDTAWARFYDWAGYDDAADAMAMTPLGDICIAGWCSDTSPGGALLAAKWDASGNRLWVSTYDGPQHGADWANSVVTDSSGDVFVAGQSDGAVTALDYLTIKYCPTGETLWCRRYDNDARDDEACAIAVGRDGSAYVTGSSMGNDYDYATVKYDADGTQLWVRRHDGAAHARDAAYAIAVDEQSNAYVTGVCRIRAYPDPPLLGCVTIKYGPDGDTAWIATYSGLQSVPCIGAAIAVDDRGCVYVAGTYNYDILTIKYVQNGGVVDDHSVAQTPEPASSAKPNPFRSETYLRSLFSGATRPRLLVFDAAGRRVRRLDGDTGSNQVIWDGKDDDGWAVPAGVYTIVVEGGQDLDQVKVVKLE